MVLLLPQREYMNSARVPVFLIPFPEKYGSTLPKGLTQNNSSPTWFPVPSVSNCSLSAKSWVNALPGRPVQWEATLCKSRARRSGISTKRITAKRYALLSTVLMHFSNHWDYFTLQMTLPPMLSGCWGSCVASRKSLQQASPLDRSLDAIDIWVRCCRSSSTSQPHGES